MTPEQIVEDFTEQRDPCLEKTRPGSTHFKVTRQRKRSRSTEQLRSREARSCLDGVVVLIEEVPGWGVVAEFLHEALRVQEVYQRVAISRYHDIPRTIQHPPL